jgi:hypothetical protein
LPRGFLAPPHAMNVGCHDADHMSEPVPVTAFNASDAHHASTGRRVRNGSGRRQRIRGQRTSKIRAAHWILGQVMNHDQKPLLMRRLEPALTDMTVQEWLDVLNERTRGTRSRCRLRGMGRAPRCDPLCETGIAAPADEIQGAAPQPLRGWPRVTAHDLAPKSPNQKRQAITNSVGVSTHRLGVTNLQ